MGSGGGGCYHPLLLSLVASHTCKASPYGKQGRARVGKECWASKDTFQKVKRGAGYSSGVARVLSMRRSWVQSPVPPLINKLKIK